ncbi:MAG: heparan-alpha-glucosaminide N-acetyltransferase domain-containing protein [Candidatus Aminicenantes bacterium]|nr:heparan-alpha-glucosaminide N-acetyltransferase domain-containing protein [Candidatus Aminicenantes bacterium]
MAQERLISLDAFRGLTVAAMVLVNNPASWTFVYAPLRHAPWHGWTPTDLIFPFFLFIVGMSMALSFARRAETGRKVGLYLKVFKRSVLLFGVGLLLHLYPRFRFATFRIPGILQRIALCFLIGALIYLNVKPKMRVVLAILLLVLYWALLTYVPVPGYGPGILDEKGNLAGYIDSVVLPGHIYKPYFDPEGLLSSLPAMVTLLLGSLAGDWLRTRNTNSRKARMMLLAGVLLTAAGLALGRYWIPINKPLWTSSYVVFTAGAALILFSLMFTLLEGSRWTGWAWPFRVLGTNAILVFAGSAIMVKTILLIKIPDAGKTVSPITWLYDHALSPLAGPYLGSLIYPIALILFWVVLIWPLYRHKIFIKL